MNGTLGLLSSNVLDAELKVSKPPTAIPFLRFSTASGTVSADSSSETTSAVLSQNFFSNSDEGLSLHGSLSLRMNLTDNFPGFT